MLVKQLLCYISNYVNFRSVAPDNIRRIILSSFDEKDISTAKKVLWNNAKAGVLKKYEGRNDTKKRSSKEANVANILQAFSDMDKKECTEIVFVAANLHGKPWGITQALHDKKNWSSGK